MIKHIYEEKFAKEVKEWREIDPTSFRKKFIIFVEEEEFYEEIELLLNFLSEVHLNFTNNKTTIWASDLSSENIAGSYEIYDGIKIDENRELRLLNLLHEIGHFVDYSEFNNDETYQFESSLKIINLPQFNKSRRSLLNSVKVQKEMEFPSEPLHFVYLISKIF